MSTQRRTVPPCRPRRPGRRLRAVTSARAAAAAIVVAVFVSVFVGGVGIHGGMGAAMAADVPDPLASGGASVDASVGAPDAAAVAASAPLEIWYHADLDGRLAGFRCGRPAPPDPDYAAIVALIADARIAAAARGDVNPLVLLGGNQAAPDLFAATLLARGLAGARDLAALLARASYDAVALGHHELSLEPEQLDALLPALAAAGLPVVASNLRCAGRRPACAAIQRERIVRRGQVTIGILATISPSVLAGVPPGRMQGLSLDPPLPAIRAGVSRLRAMGATWVVLMTQGPRGAGALDEIDLLQRSLAGAGAGAGPDLILAGGLTDEESGRGVQLLRRDGAPPVTASPAGTAGLSRVRLSAGEVLVETRPAVTSHDDADTRALLARQEASTCATVMEPLSPGAVRGTMGRDDFVKYLLEVMRRRAGAEIAIINHNFVKRAPFPITGRITHGDLDRALPYRAVLGAARIPGPTVESLIAPALANTKLSVVGLARGSGGALEINGRPLDKARAYRVATISFVADGGDGILARHALPFTALGGSPDLRDVVASFLRGSTAAQDGDPTVDVATDFGPRAAARPLWVVLADVGFDLADTTVSNPVGYSNAQLTRAQQTSVKGQVTLVGQLRHPVHEADARFDVQYGWSRSQPAGAPAVSGETADLVTAIAQYTYRGLRDLRHVPRAAVPDPYARAWLESELTPPPVTTTQPREYRHLQLTNTVGAQFTLGPRFKLRGGAGAQKELLTSAGDPGRWRAVVEAGATLDPTAIATWGALAVKLDGSLNYDLVDPTEAQTRQHQVRSTWKIAVPLVPHLFITVGVDVFAVKRGGQDWGASYDTTVGIRAHTDAAYQRL